MTLVSADATHYLGLPSCLGLISSIIYSFNQFNNSGSCGSCYFVNFEAVVVADVSKHFLLNFAFDQHFVFEKFYNIYCPVCRPAD